LRFLALLAYPPGEIDKANVFLKSMRSWQTKVCLWQKVLRRLEVNKEYGSWKNEALVGKINRGFDRIVIRTQAGTIAKNVVVDGHTRYESVKMLLKSGKKKFGHGWRGEDVSNVYRLIWHPSKPVIHMAYAYRYLLVKRGLKMYQTVFEPEWLPDVLKWSEYLRGKLPNYPLKIDKDSLIRLV
jgi:hypothetical protein